tara:strand:- start:41 stop:280 length:240 start_codon:yes stop_codon:yes gene_type:complete
MSTSEVRPSNRKGRPNYPKAYKREVAMAACAADVSVAKLAMAHGLVFPPFWEVVKSRVHAAMANFWMGVNPPNAMFGRS